MFEQLLEGLRCRGSSSLLALVGAVGVYLDRLAFFSRSGSFIFALSAALLLSIEYLEVLTKNNNNKGL